MSKVRDGFTVPTLPSSPSSGLRIMLDAKKTHFNENSLWWRLVGKADWKVGKSVMHLALRTVQLLLWPQVLT